MYDFFYLNGFELATLIRFAQFKTHDLDLFMRQSISVLLGQIIAFFHGLQGS